MKHIASRLVAIAVIATEVLSVGLYAVPASAQESFSQQTKRQQRLILQQQRQIERNQHLLGTQQRQMHQASDAAPTNGTNGPLGGLLGISCPPHYYYIPSTGCLPDLNYLR